MANENAKQWKKFHEFVKHFCGPSEGKGLISGRGRSRRNSSHRILNHHQKIDLSIDLGEISKCGRYHHQRCVFIRSFTLMQESVERRKMRQTKMSRSHLKIQG